MNNLPNPDSSGYVKYYAVDSLQASSELFTQEDLFYIDMGVYGEASPKFSGGCNIDFGTFLDIDWNLDFLQFEIMPPPFDASLFDKADAISIEVSIINDMLINSILDMGCCDIAKVYNTTMIPFFQFFGDAPDSGENLMSTMIKYAEIITAMRAIVEPLDCLVRFVPNNPWLPKDVDPLSWVYGYFKETSPVLNRILSGELLDIILNPIHQIRTKLQSCLYNGVADFNWNAITEIGSAQQLEAISKLAVRNGGTIIDYQPPLIDKPIKPKVEDYGGNENDYKYKEALKLYESKNKKYEFYLARQKTIKEEQKRQSIQLQNINQHLGVSAQTSASIKISTNGICGCAADALGLNNITIENIPFRTTDDLFNSVINKTHSNATYKDIGAITKNEPKDEKATIQPKHLSNKNTKKKIVDACQPTGTTGKKIIKTTVNENWKNPYSKISYGPEELNVKVEKFVVSDTKSDPNSKLIENDKSQQEIRHQERQIQNAEQEKSKLSLSLKEFWSQDKKIAEKILLDAKKELDGLVANNDSTYRKKAIEFEVATNIFNSYFGTFRPFDFENDPEDYSVLSQYLPDLANSWMYPPEYWDSIPSFDSRLLQTYSAEIKALPFDLDKIEEDSLIQELPLSTEVDIDERTKTNYFNGGFVRRGGSSSWRNFNRLDIEYNDSSVENGAIARDKSHPVYTAIFPTESIGNKACLSYLREKYIPSTFLKIFAPNELKKKDATLENELLAVLEEKYGYTWEQHLSEFNDNDLINIINEISLFNGYQKGKLWVKTKLFNPKINSDIDFEYRSNTDFPEIIINGKKIPRDLIASSGDTVADRIAKVSNESIRKRGHYYLDVSKIEKQRQAFGSNIDTARYAIMNSIAGFFPAEMKLMIPCTCENFLCMLLNHIIQYFMSTVNQLIQEIMNMIVKFLIPDWIKDLIRVLQDFLACVGSIFGIADTLKSVHEYSSDLLDSLRGRIRLYPADPCFIPDDQFEDYSIDEPGEGWVGEPIEHPIWQPPYEMPDTGTYYPANFGTDFSGINTNDNGFYPSPLIYPPVVPEKSEPGRHYPAFKFNCDYLWL